MNEILYNRYLKIFDRVPVKILKSEVSARGCKEGGGEGRRVWGLRFGCGRYEGRG